MKGLFLNTKERYLLNLKKIFTHTELCKMIENYNYLICNYELLVAFFCNRGEIRGISISRSKRYKKLMDEVNFDFQMSLISITVDGVVVDGNSRVWAFMALGLPIPVKVISDRTIEQVSFYNTHPSPKWIPNEQLESALQYGYLGAIEIDRVMGEYRNKHMFGMNEISVSEVYSVIMRKPEISGSGKYQITVGMFNDPKLMEMAEMEGTDVLLGKYFMVRDAVRQIEKRNRISQYALDLHLQGQIDMFDFIKGLNVAVFKFKRTEEKKENSYEKKALQKEILRVANIGKSVKHIKEPIDW